jgi:hypothetical protein
LSARSSFSSFITRYFDAARESESAAAGILEGADDPDAVKDYLRRYSWQGIHRLHADLVAMSQRRASRRTGENDAWQAAIAEQMGAVLAGHDQKAFRRVGAAYEDHWRK